MSDHPIQPASAEPILDTAPQRMWLPLVIGMVVLLIAVLLLYFLVDLDALAHHLRTARLEYLVLAMGVFYPLSVVTRSVRWWLLLNKKISFARCLHILNVGYMANMIFPARLGEVVRLLLVRNEPEGSTGQAISAVAVERLVDLLFALLTIAMGLALARDTTSLPPEVVTSLVIFIVATVIGFAILFFIPPLHPLIERLVRGTVGRFLPALEERVAGLVMRTLYSMRELASPTRLMMILGWTLITWTLYVVAYYVILLAFISSPPIGVGILVVGFVALSIGVPSVPSYAGPFHVGAVLALSMYGYNESLAASFALTAHAVSTILTILIGFYSMSALKMNFQSLRRMVDFR